MVTTRRGRQRAVSPPKQPTLVPQEEPSAPPLPPRRAKQLKVTPSVDL